MPGMRETVGTRSPRTTARRAVLLAATREKSAQQQRPSTAQISKEIIFKIESKAYVLRNFYKGALLNALYDIKNWKYLACMRGLVT